MPRDFFEEFEREFNNLFKMTFSTFNRPVKDMQPYRYIKKENGYILVINTLGISKEDIKVQITTEKGDPYRYLHIKGATKLDKFDFENRVDLVIRLYMVEEVEEFAYEVKDGLTVVYLKTKKNPEESFQAKYIEDSTDLGF
jgi:HSP20 family molecular chaperone IbpA